MPTEKLGELIPRRQLASCGFAVRALGMGCAGLGDASLVTDEEAVATVQLALESGLDYIDTAPLYGESERRVGMALRGVPRESYRLSTKTGTHPSRLGDYTWDGTLWSIDNSLRLLGVDHVDLLLIHDPDSMEPVMAPGGALDALEHLQDEGVIGAIGLGQRRHDFHEIAIRSGRFDVILTYNDYHPIRTAALPHLLPLARAHGMDVINGSPLGHGLLRGAPTDQMEERIRQFQSPREYEMAERLRLWCLERNINMPGLALQFSLRQPLIDVTLTGASRPAELRQNLEGVTTPLDENIWRELDELNLTAGQV